VAAGGGDTQNSELFRNTMASKSTRIQEALSILRDLDMPRAQQNERSALALLALIDLKSTGDWVDAKSPLIGITPIMDWARGHYDKEYAPNTRESFRKQTVHQFTDAGLALLNPDKPDRPTTSPHTVYQIEPTCLALLRSFGSSEYELKLKGYKAARIGLAERYAKHRKMKMVPVKIAGDKQITLSPGEHSELIRKIWEVFAAQFIPGGELVYVGDTGEKWGYFDETILTELSVAIGSHGKMPDVAVYDRERNWLVLAEAVTSHGPVDGKRHDELQRLFRKTRAGLLFVSAFPDRRTFRQYAEIISWETEVWIADSPTHLIHYNGARFLGPYGA
jgi:hypothetical protein